MATLSRAVISAVLATSSLLPALGSLEAAVRRSSLAHGTTTVPATERMRGPVVLPLRRAGARSSAAQEANFYVGEVSVGYPPKQLEVVFDTASGHVLLPHRACHDAACLERTRYSPWESLTAVDINGGGGAVQAGHQFASANLSRDSVTVTFSQSDLGEGNVESIYVRDAVCVDQQGGAAAAGPGHACVEVAVLAAVQMDERPFRAMPGDGIVGLGLAALSASPLCNFMERLLLDAAPDVLRQFGLALGADVGELHLGGHSLARLAEPLRWFPVDHPEQGYWQVAIQAVRVGDHTIDDCAKGCHGIVDSAVSRLGVQTSKLPVVRAALTSSSRGGDGSGDRGCQGPDLLFDLGGMVLTLGASDYADQEDCRPLLGPLELPEPEFVGVYTLGATLLRRYYAAFDWEERRLGFAPLADSPQPLTGSPSAALPDELAGVLHV